MTMSLSVLCQTYGANYAGPFLAKFRRLADALDADFVIVGDGYAGELLAKDYADKVVRIDMQHTPEEGIYPGCKACKGDWVLRFDDDETLSTAMRQWLVQRRWEQATESVFSFPYCWLWGDAQHFITSPPFYPDPHARLMPKRMMEQWLVTPHAGNLFGLGLVVPVAHLHHKFLVQSREHRERHAAKLDAVQQGYGLGAHYGKFMFPERFCDSIRVREVGDGHLQLGEWIETGENVDLSATR